MAPDPYSSTQPADYDAPPGGRSHRGPRGNGIVFWILAVLLLALPTITLPSEGSWLAVKAFALEAAAVTLAVLVFSRGEWTARRLRAAFLTPVNLAVLGFLLWIGVSAAIATVPHLARYEALRHLGGGLVYFAALYGISVRRQLNQVVWLVAGVGSLSALAAFLNAGETDIERVAGAFHNQQLLAGFLCLILPLVLVGSQMEKETWPRMGLQVAVVIIGAGVLVTRNRSSWLGVGAAILVVGLLYLLWGRERHAGLQKSQVVIPVLMVVLTVGLFLGMSRMSGSLSQRAGTLSAIGEDSSFQWRLAMWEKCVRMVRDRPLTGWGIGSFPLQQALYPHPGIQGRTQIEILKKGPSLAENAHNSLLQLAADTGIPGLLLFLGIYVAFFATALRALPGMRRGFRQGVVMGCVGGVVAQVVSSFGNPAWEFAECSTFFWFILALGMAAAGVSSRGREPDHRSA